MVNIIYANKNTGTVIHDIYLSCKESEVKDTILKFGTVGVEFPVKFIKELPQEELDYILYAMNGSVKKQKELLNCFYISCVKIWEEVKLDEIDFSFEFDNLQEEGKINARTYK
jgi:hypothetical protein